MLLAFTRSREGHREITNADARLPGISSFGNDFGFAVKFGLSSPFRRCPPLPFLPFALPPQTFFALLFESQGREVESSHEGSEAVFQPLNRTVRPRMLDPAIVRQLVNGDFQLPCWFVIPLRGIYIETLFLLSLFLDSRCVWYSL